MRTIISPKIVGRQVARLVRSLQKILPWLLLTMFSVTGYTDDIFAVGDIANCGNLTPPEQSEAARTSLWIPKDADVLLLGDLVYPRGEKQYFDKCFRPIWGVHDTHAYPSPGNHEYERDSTAAGYFDYFKENGLVRYPGYYAFERKRWLLISLNSNLFGEQFNEQLTWLKNLIARDQGHHSCVLAYWHHPLFTSGVGHINKVERRDNMRAFWSILHTARADLILNGHEHLYESFDPLNEDGQPDPTGPREFIVGTGGGKLDEFSEQAAVGSRERIAHRYAVMKLDLRDDSYHWELRSNHIILDQGVANCLGKISTESAGVNP